METFISTSGEPSANRIDLPALTLVGLPRNNPKIDPLLCTTPKQPTIYVRKYLVSSYLQDFSIQVKLSISKYYYFITSLERVFTC